MKGFLAGEGRISFPYFIKIISLLIALYFLQIFGPNEVFAQKERNKLSSFDLLAERATQLNKRGLYDEVIALLELQKDNPQNDSALFFNELGIAYRFKGKLAEAIEAYKSALLRDPHNPVILNNLGFTYYLKNNYDQAIECYQNALKLAPFFKEAHSNLSLAYYKLGKYKEALEKINRVLELDPSHQQAQKFREVILKKIKEQNKKNP